VLLLLSLPAQAKETAGDRFVRSVDRMMVELGPQSARASKTIRSAYRAHLAHMVLEEYSDLERALANGGLAPLPGDPIQFNLAPRLAGPSPIGEKDLDNQVSYIAARPATIGALMDIASRVKSGPIEITSLVRHSEYQGALRRTNGNATTSVPMHTMGLAFDIALLNTPLETVYEIRDVLERMRDAGEILFIGERRQLVFHVVPHPSRLGHFTDVYTRTLGVTPTGDGPHVVAFSPARNGSRSKPTVSAEVVAVLPTGEFAEEWWAAADHTEADVAIEVSPEPAPVPAPATDATMTAGSFMAARFLTLIAAMMTLVWRLVTRRPDGAGPNATSTVV